MGANPRPCFTRPRQVLLLTGCLAAVASGILRGQDCHANASITVGRASAPEGQVTVDVRGSSVCEVTGFSLAIGHDAKRVEFVRAEPGPFLQDAARGSFFSADGNNAGGFMTVFAVFGFNTPPVSIPEDAILARVRYRIKPGVRPGTTLLRNTHRAFGSPPVANIFTTRRSAIDPVLRDGAIVITDCNTGSSLSLGHASAAAGEVSVELRGGSFCDVTGFTMAVGHEAARVEFLRAEPGPFLTTRFGNALVFEAGENNDEGFMRLRVAFGGAPPAAATSIRIPEDSHLATVFYLVRPRVPRGVVILRNESEAFGDPPIVNAFTTRDAMLDPELEDGSITIVEVVQPVSEFQRGDADADGDLDFSDAVIMITLRTPGGLQPTCLKAADANDDGSVNLNDALYLLDFLFRISPAPPPPFMECGLDPTADALTCRSFPPCS